MEFSIAPDEVAVVLFVLIFLGTLPPAWRLLRTRSKTPTFEDIRHEDQDGAATKESMAQFSNKPQFIVLFVFGLCGLGLSFAHLVIAAVNAHGEKNVAVGIWLLPPAWLFLLVQLTDTIREAQPVTRFESAIWKQATTVLIGGIVLDVSASEYAQGGSRATATKLLIGLQLPTIPVLLGAIWCVKRRPAVFTAEGKEVDQEMTASLWDRFTFRWAPGLMAAGAKEALEYEHLPAMNHAVRSKQATDDFSAIALNNTLPLWIRVAWHLRTQLIRQWIAILISNFFDVAPTFAILQLLQYLETRENSDVLDLTAWKYVLTIGAATVASTLVDSRIMWWEKGYIVDALRSTLTGLVYRKLLKKKISADPPKKEEEKEKEEPAQDGPSKSEEDIINMFAVDCNQIAMFASESSQYVNIVGKMLVTVTFLLLLVGWQSLCAGLLGIAVLFPINEALARRYGKKQKALMAIRDKRTAMTTEALHGIRQIKFSAAEGQWTEKLEAVREEELAVLWSSRVDNIYMTIGSEFSPVVLTSLCLATYSYVYGGLLPSVAFTAISLFRQLEGIVSQIPYLMVAAITAKVSSDRIDKFLHSSEKGENTHPGEAVSFHGASVSFPCDDPDSLTDRFTLRNLNLVFPNHALSVISGPTGSGKSLLLAAILGEVEVLDGYVHVPRDASPQDRFDNKATAANWILPTAIAFVSQTPWIENATIKNNILFGLPLDPARYQQVIEACALTADLALFEDGDETEVGVQGVSLSGGQKWRLSLARAIYSRAGILIMDDVFSALDAHVGKHVYENAVMGELAEGRTRILATHHVSLCLSGAKYAVSLSVDGTLKHAGAVDQLEADGELESIKDTEEREILIEEEEEGPIPPAAPAPLAPKAPPKKLIEDEKRPTGRVATSVYAGYLKATGGWPFWVFLLVIFALSESLSLGRTYWVRIWANSYGDKEELSQYTMCSYRSTAQISLAGYSTQTLCSSSSSGSLPIDINHRSVWFYLGMYCLISTLSVAVAVGRLFNISAGSVRASRSIFKATLHSVFRAPLRWFDTVPTGRILNRFTGDFISLDSNLSEVFYYFSSAIWELIGIMVAASFISPFMILVAPPLLVICAIIGQRYIGAARNVKRLESNSKSPVISHFAASLSGLSTIRAFSKSDEFAQRMYKLIDTYAACTWYSGLLGSWLGLWVGVISSLFPAAIAAFVIMTPGTDASLAGFALSFSITFHFMTAWTIRITTRLELYMNATERIFEYRDLQGESPDGDSVRASWPETGRIEVNELEVGYAEGLPSILKGLTFTADPNQRIGVVGRTGAGKSTLSLALFRFLHTRKGSVVIDGVDISKIRLHDLRTRLAIIPQDPVLFSGTIRSNLDPMDQYSDHEIREALMRVHLIPSGSDTPLPKPDQVDSSGASSTIAGSEESGNANIFLSLSSPITAGGSNLSQGQKQLLCLARAILSRPKILILDEATSAVDMETDMLIQRSIREAFTDTTLLVIAHRLSTVADFDRILVMKDGVAAEFGTPGELVETEGGIFQDMVNKSGEVEELRRMILE